MSKIGILGGTFNPIHNGHIALAKAAYEQFALDKVILISSGMSYFKKDIIMPSKEHRYNMTKLACDNYTYFEASDIEKKKEGYSYTYETLNDLSLIYPDSDFYYIIGADTLFSITSWKNPEVIFNMCTLLVAVRDDVITDDLINRSNELKHAYNANIELINFNRIDLSSTELRKKIVDKKDVSEYIPNNVLEYINKNNLYSN